MLALALFLMLGTPEEAPVASDMAAIFLPDDYPVEAIDQHQQGNAITLVDVAADGRVVGCRIARSSGVAVLDATSCRLIFERGRFTETSKRHVGQAYRLRIPVGWQLGDPGIPLVEMDWRIIYSIRDRRITGCREVVVAGPASISGGCSGGRAATVQAIGQIGRTRPLKRNDYVLQIRSIPGDHRTDEIGNGPGDVLLSRQVTLLTIGADGKVVDCKTDSSAPGSGAIADNECKASVANEHFPALPAGDTATGNRLLTRINVIYLTPSPAR